MQCRLQPPGLLSADYYALLSPHIGSDSSYNRYDPSYHDTSLYNQIR